MIGDGAELIPVMVGAVVDRDIGRLAVGSVVPDRDKADVGRVTPKALPRIDAICAAGAVFPTAARRGII